MTDNEELVGSMVTAGLPARQADFLVDTTTSAIGERVHSWEISDGTGGFSFTSKSHADKGGKAVSEQHGWFKHEGAFRRFNHTRADLQDYDTGLQATAVAFDGTTHLRTLLQGSTVVPAWGQSRVSELTWEIDRNRFDEW